MVENTQVPDGSSAPAVRYVQDDLVVGMPDEALVLRRLRERHGLVPSAVLASPALGLTLLRGLHRPDGPPDGPDQPDVPPVPPGGPDGTLGGPDGTQGGLDAVLAELRAYFAAGYGGWTPELGKNREVSSVATFGGGTRGMAVTGPAPEGGGTRGMSGHSPDPAGGGTRGMSGHSPAPDGGGTRGMALPGVLPAGGGTRGMALPGVLPAGGGTRGMAGHGPVLAGGGTRGMGTGFPLGELGQALATGPGTGGGALVGILDGPLYPHPDLVGHVPAELLLHALLAAQLHGGDRRQWEGHATFVASVIARQAPLAALDPRAVLGGETGTASLWDTATALVGFAGSGAAVLNLSFGCRTLDGRPPLLVARAVERLGPDVLCVAAAGNHGDLPDIRQDPVWPAALPGVVAVGATDEPGARFSPALPWVRCTAPGVGVSGAYLAGTVLNPADPEHAEPWSQEYHGYARWSGTSFAAAAVTGAVAAAIRPGMTAREALEELLATPDGLVRPYQQVDAVLA